MRSVFPVLPCLLVAALSRSGPARATAAAAASPLRITEFLAGPARDWDGNGVFSSRDDEWVEVKNAGSVPLDLSSYFLTDDDGIPRFGFSGVLPPGERVFVTGGVALEWERAFGRPAVGLSLANSGDAVKLWQVVGPETLLVDAYTYKTHEAASDRSVGRADDEGPWSLFDGLNPYTGSTSPTGTGCPPTPNAANVCGLTPIRPATWGKLKALYR
jgi:hypothetical protein